MPKSNIFFVLLFCLLLPLESFAQPKATNDALLQKAKQLLTHMKQKKYSAAVMMFDATMKKAFPARKLGMTWTMIQLQVGLLEHHHSTKSTLFRGYQIYKLLCKFQRSWLMMRVVFDKSGQIAGLQFRPAKAPLPKPSSRPSSQGTTQPSSKPISQPTANKFTYHVLSYAKPNKFTEQELQFGEGKWKLPGTLTLPKGTPANTVIILVHGSGAHDRDETIGPNKPFRDLAWGLASQGIAVFRYVKRSKLYAKQMLLLRNKLTIREVTIDDAVAAAKLLRKTKGIHPKKIFVLGHSLGGYALPRIGRKAKWLAGLISLAGSSRPLEDLILEQMSYVLALDGNISKKEAKIIENLEIALGEVKAPTLKLTTPSKILPLGMPAAFWLDMRRNPVTQIARTLTNPMLFIQGGRDYQVTTDDFNGWKGALSGKKNASFKLFPSLNHLMMTGKGKSKPSEYIEQGHVDVKVIKAIANWISAL